MSHLRASEGEIERLRALIRGMSYHSAIYKLLRDELTVRGNWRNAPRGNPKAGFRAAQLHIKQQANL